MSMQTTPLHALPPEIIAEIVSYLDFQDQEQLHYTCGAFFRMRSLGLSPLVVLDRQKAWLRTTENQQDIPVDELISHHAFIRIMNNIFAFEPPRIQILDAIVEFFVQELISSWMLPRTDYHAESRINGSMDDTRTYHRRYPQLFRLAMILRHNGVGPKIATAMREWLDSIWREIENDEEIQKIHPIDLSALPWRGSFTARQQIVLYGIHSIALFPLIHLSPQSPASESINSPINDVAWADIGYDRLKLWMSIPELWNLEIRHIGLTELLRPFRIFRIVNSLPFLQLVLDKAAEFGGFPFRILQHARLIEMTTPRHFLTFPDSRYWYEEGFVRARIWWNFKAFEFPGQYVHLLKKPFVDLIHGYIALFGVGGLSDLIFNMVHVVRIRSLPTRVLVARTMMSELLVYGYEFLTPEAINAIVELARDHETGRLFTNVIPVDYSAEPAVARGERRSRRFPGL
jgi:hypothetical protein